MEKIKKFAPIGAVVLALVAIIMCFLPGAAVEGDSMSVWETIFGYSETYAGESMNVVGFSFLNLIPLLCVVVGAVLVVLNVMGKGSNLFGIVAAVLFVVAGIFFFLVTTNAMPGSYFDTIPEAYRDASWEAAKDAWDLGVGAILAAICSIIAAVCAACPVVLDKMGK
ncbi:MAG: hypothetical protein IJY11_00140 [Clostridia bacterium]|nr:hypothetical protein [Clostridia bacterium]